MSTDPDDVAEVIVAAGWMSPEDHERAVDMARKANAVVIEHWNRADKAEAALKDTARMLANRTRALQRVEMFVEELAAADDGSADKDYRLGRFVVSEIRGILAEPERDEEGGR